MGGGAISFRFAPDGDFEYLLRCDCEALLSLDFDSRLYMSQAWHKNAFSVRSLSHQHIICVYDSHSLSIAYYAVAASAVEVSATTVVPFSNIFAGTIPVTLMSTCVRVSVSPEARLCSCWVCPKAHETRKLG